MLALLPVNWFNWLPNTSLGNAGLLLIAAVCLVIVIKGADWLVEGAAGLAFRLGMPKVVIGATIVSLGTTSPEAAVSVLAAWGGNSGLALGNGVGSIIADTGLIFAIGCLWTRLPADKFLLTRQGLVKIGVAVALAVICYVLYAVQGDAARIGRGVGLVLVAGLVVYLAASVRWSREHAQRLEAQAAASGEGKGEGEGGDGDPPGEGVLDPVLAETEQVVEDRTVPVLIVLGIVGLSLVVFAGDGLVQSVTIVTKRWGVPDVVVAATLVAFGTSLPELMVGITSIRKGHPELLVGNVIGADILNVLFVIGAAAVAQPLSIIEPDTEAPAIFLYLHLPVMLVMLGLMLGGIFGAVRRGYFARWLGVPLLLLYVGYVIAQFVISAPSAQAGV